MKKTALPAYTLLVAGWIACLVAGDLFSGAGVAPILPASGTYNYKSTIWLAANNTMVVPQTPVLTGKPYFCYPYAGNAVVICTTRSCIKQPGFMLTANQ